MLKPPSLFISWVSLSYLSFKIIASDENSPVNDIIAPIWTLSNTIFEDAMGVKNKNKLNSKNRK